MMETDFLWQVQLGLVWNCNLFFKVGACWSGLCEMNVNKFRCRENSSPCSCVRPVTTFAQTKPKSLDYFLANWFLFFWSLHPLWSCILHASPTNHLHILRLFSLPSHHPSVKVPPLPTRPPAMHGLLAGGLPTRHPTRDESRVIPTSRCSRPPATQKQGGISYHAIGTEKPRKHTILPPHIVQKETMHWNYGWVWLVDVAGQKWTDNNASFVAFHVLIPGSCQILIFFTRSLSWLCARLIQ